MLLATAAVAEAVADRPGAAALAAAEPALTLFTFGDSVLDCGHYNRLGLDPGQLIVRNNDRVFPEFEGRDLRSHGGARRVHRAADGATVDDLASQASRLPKAERRVALLSIGGNDLLRGLAADTGAGTRRFEAALNRFVQALPIRPVFMATVYDPTFGDDARNFLRVDAKMARANHRRVNQIIGECADRYGKLVDLHAHFLRGDPSWFTQTIEPSRIGASEIRRVFLPALGVT